METANTTRVGPDNNKPVCPPNSGGAEIACLETPPHYTTIGAPLPD